MLEYKGYNDYAVEVYRNNELLGTFRYVSNVWFIVLWLDIHFQYRKWTTIVVYHRLTQTFIGKYSKTDSIPAKPQI